MMKPQNVYLLLICAGLSLLSSCYQDFHYKGEFSPRLVLHSFILGDSVVRAEVSTSWLMGTEPAYEVKSDARVLLYLNDELKEKVTISERSYWVPGNHAWLNLAGYYSNLSPKAGDKIRIEAEADGFRTVSGETIIPEIIDIRKVECYLDEGAEGGEDIQFRVTFQDEYGIRNYYGIKIVEWRKSMGDSIYYYQQGCRLNFKNEPVVSYNSPGSIVDDLFDSSIWGLNGDIYPFTDDLIDGKEYTLKMSTSVGYYRSDSKYTIALYSLSDSYYKYLVSLIQQGMGKLSDWGLMDPTLIYQNVENGIGLIGACQIDTLNIYPDLKNE